MKDSSKVLLGFVAGVAAAAGIYALAKSEKGQQLIEEIKDTASQWKEELDSLLRKGKKAAEETEEDIEGSVA